MAKVIVLFVTLLCVIPSSAAGQDIRYNFDKSADFSRFKTYRWVVKKDAEEVDQLTDKDIKAAVNAELSKRGLEIDDSDNAQLDVRYQASVDQEKQFNSYTSSWGPGWGWDAGSWSGWTTTTTSTIYTGQLTLDFYDSHSHDLIWRGAVSQTIDPYAKPEKQEKKLEKAVAKLLKNFPPQKKSG